MLDILKAGLAKSFVLKGRTSRRAYWLYSLVSAGVVVAAVLLDLALGKTILQPLASLALMPAGLSIFVRRLHDTGRSGAWAVALYAMGIVMAGWAVLMSTPHTQPAPAITFVFLALTLAFVIAAITTLVFTVLRGTEGDNRFGSPGDPRLP